MVVSVLVVGAVVPLVAASLASAGAALVASVAADGVGVALEAPAVVDVGAVVLGVSVVLDVGAAVVEEIPSVVAEVGAAVAVDGPSAVVVEGPAVVLDEGAAFAAVADPRPAAAPAPAAGACTNISSGDEQPARLISRASLKSKSSIYKKSLVEGLKMHLSTLLNVHGMARLTSC